MNKMIDSIIFDVDGTIWDSRDAVARAWNEVFTAEHVNLQVDVACLTGYFGQMLPDIARQLLPDYKEDEQMRIIGLCCEEEHRKLYAEGAPAYDGLEDTLKKLSARYPLLWSATVRPVILSWFWKKPDLVPTLQDIFAQVIQERQKHIISVQLLINII